MRVSAKVDLPADFGDKRRFF